MKAVWIFIACIILALFFYGIFFHSKYIIKFNITLFKSQSNSKKILFWTPIFGVYGSPTNGSKPYQSCSISACQSLINRHEITISDAVIFHIRDIDLNDMPTYRSPHQKWIFLLQESPPHSGIDFTSIDSIFNWTMTYRRDSDIFMPYGRISKKENIAFSFADTAMRNYSQEKTKLAVWFVSKCDTPSLREFYVRLLQKYISVDIIGGCGLKKCSREFETECLRNASKTYKFFFSFENSICTDYITEKFFNPLMYDMVPVVYGGGNYSSIAPPHSYIDVSDFKNPQELSKYLLFLDKNFTEYNKYFKWKNKFTVNGKVAEETGFCALCKKLHLEENKSKRYLSIKKWWIEGSCHHGKILGV